VLLLQPCELVFEFALIFVGHDVRQLENADEIAKGEESRARNIVPASPVCKLAGVPYSRFVTDDRRKMRAPVSLAIDRFAGSCKLGCPDRI
jgi:hypothetical protein